MSERFDFDPAFLGELIARRWQEDRGFYSLNTHADQVGNQHETGARRRLSGPHVPLTRFPGGSKVYRTVRYLEMTAMQDTPRPRTPLRARLLEGLWSQRADHSGVELHWIRRAGPHRAAELVSPA